MADRGEQLWAFATAISRSAPVLLGRFDQAGAVEKAKAELCTADPSTRTWAAVEVWTMPRPGEPDGRLLLRATASSVRGQWKPAGRWGPPGTWAVIEQALRDRLDVGPATVQDMQAVLITCEKPRGVKAVRRWLRKLGAVHVGRDEQDRRRILWGWPDAG